MGFDDAPIALGKLGHDRPREIIVRVKGGAHVLAWDQGDPAFFDCPGGHQIGGILDRRGKDECGNRTDDRHGGFAVVPA